VFGCYCELFFIVFDYVFVGFCVVVLMVLCDL